MDDRSPLPPPDLPTRSLPMETIAAGTDLFRIHRTKFGPAHFGRAALYRFDCPDGNYGVLYCGLSKEVAFAQNLLRGPEPLVATSKSRSAPSASFRLSGPSGSCGSSGQAFPQSERRLRPHRDVTRFLRHGRRACITMRKLSMEYLRSTADNDQKAIALFDRVTASIRIQETSTLLSDAVRRGEFSTTMGPHSLAVRSPSKPFTALVFPSKGAQLRSSNLARNPLGDGLEGSGVLPEPHLVAGPNGLRIAGV